MDNNINNNINDIESRANIPSNIKNITNQITDDILNSPYIKDSMLYALQSVQYSIKVKPLSYVDERKYYTCVDSAYKVYEQLLASDNKMSKTEAWIFANIAMFGWFYKDLFGIVHDGREVERVVDLALRSPSQFMLKYVLLGIVNAVPALVSTGASIFTGNYLYLIVSVQYIIQILINLIKTSLKIRKAETTPLDAIRPTA